MAGSPQSMLCGCKNGLSRGSSNCRSPAEANRNETSWDLLYAAAGEVARMRMVEEAASHNASQRLRKIGTHDLHYQQLKVAKISLYHTFRISLSIINSKTTTNRKIKHQSEAGVGSGC
ncbi:hypothetical protein Hdeb2414_s0124g00804511 [Helianthus debilis subsp. tardiflorus]